MNLFDAVPHFVKQELQGVDIDELSRFEYLKYLTHIETLVWNEISITNNAFNRNQVLTMIQNASNLIQENPNKFEELLG
tara:strand:- start:11945 stop:12181 length:237 start_codon:yes stop_codon:yes gene_type:complete